MTMREATVYLAKGRQYADDYFLDRAPHRGKYLLTHLRSLLRETRTSAEYLDARTGFHGRLREINNMPMADIDAMREARVRHDTFGDDRMTTVQRFAQTQVGLSDQLRLLREVANRLGLYDAADYLRGKI